MQQTKPSLSVPWSSQYLRTHQATNSRSTDCSQVPSPAHRLPGPQPPSNIAASILPEHLETSTTSIPIRFVSAETSTTSTIDQSRDSINQQSAFNRPVTREQKLLPTMCLIIQTLHSCQHKQYSNTFPCVAAGRPPNQAALTTTKFLPELRPPEQDQQPACQKRYPVRPVRTLCTQCQREVVKAKAFGTGVAAGEQPANKNPSDLRRERTEREVVAVEAELGDISRGKDYPHLDPATGQWKGPAAPEMPADYRPSSSRTPLSTGREQRAAPWALDLPRMPEPTYNNQALDDWHRGRPRSRRDGRPASRRRSRNAAGRARLLADPSHHRQDPLPPIREVDERAPGHEGSGERDSSPTSAHGISRPKPTYDHKGKGRSTSPVDLVTAQGPGVDAAAGPATLSFDTGRRLSRILANQTTGSSASTGPWGKGQD